VANRFATLQQVHGEIRYAHRAHFSFFYQLQHRAPGIFYGRPFFVRPVKLIQINALDAKPLEGSFTLAANRFRCKDALSGLHGIFNVPAESALGEDKWALRSRQFAKHLSNDFLGMPQAVDGGCVDPIDAQVQGVSHGCDRFGVILWSPTEGPAASANGPRTETDSSNVESAGTQRPCWQSHGGASKLSR